MRYFSGKGDSGETNLFDGRKVSKDDPILELIGTTDELRAQIGLAISLTIQSDIKKTLRLVQITLSKIMGLIAGAEGSSIGDLDIPNGIIGLEEVIDNYGHKLDPVEGFNFSGKTTSGAAIDLCRVMARKAERRALTYIRENKLLDQDIIAYLNRLSSLFYVFSLFVDQTINIDHVK
ncbi:MAG: cob(I)yrinic acid a,c-diamide adenosyltransferase [Anaerolineaceae bacterium]|nr:cob(I)yrinic acid a,c-diamide adenosyltransferase [Anaerolineaceae bacterium]